MLVRTHLGGPCVSDRAVGRQKQCPPILQQHRNTVPMARLAASARAEVAVEVATWAALQEPKEGNMITRPSMFVVWAYVSYRAVGTALCDVTCAAVLSHLGGAAGAEGGDEQELRAVEHRQPRQVRVPEGKIHRVDPTFAS